MSSYYVRARGKQTGPISVSQAQGLVKRKRLSRQHEVSVDGINWSRAGDDEVLFPKAVVKTMDVPVMDEPEPEVALSEPTETLWHYTYNDAEHGPVEADEIRRMLAAGQLTGDDKVWNDTLPAWVDIGRAPDFIMAVPRARKQQKAAGPSGGVKPDNDDFEIDPRALVAPVLVFLAMLMLIPTFVMMLAAYVRPNAIGLVISITLQIMTVACVAFGLSFGHSAMKRCTLSGGTVKGGTIALRSTIMGYVVVALWIAANIMALTTASGSSSTSPVSPWF